MTLSDIFVNILSLTFGFVVGLLFSWTRRDKDGKPYLVPTLYLTAKKVDLLLAAGVLVAIAGTTAYAVESTQTTMECSSRIWEYQQRRAEAFVEWREAEVQALNDIAQQSAYGTRPVDPDFVRERVRELETVKNAVDEVQTAEGLGDFQRRCLNDAPGN